MPPTIQCIPGIVPADEAAIDEVFGSLPTQLSINDKTPVSLTPAVVSFSPFFQTSKQSIPLSLLGAVVTSKELSRDDLTSDGSLLIKPAIYRNGTPS
jgi:hypothetical protein